MRTVNAEGPGARLTRRLQRLWRRRSLRRFVTMQGPALAMAAGMAWLASNPATHAAVAERWTVLREALTERPEFAIRRVIVEGADPSVEAEVLASLFDVEGASSIDLDADAVRARVESLGWIAGARVALEAPETLRVAVEQRVAAAVWRIDGEPYLIDPDGAIIEPAFSRADHPSLPLVAGRGAPAAAAEALALVDAAGPLRGRLRGLVRVGDRRWNAVFTGKVPGADVTLMLPEGDAIAAMARAVGAHRDHGLFDRDLSAVDLRLPGRPTARLTKRTPPPPVFTETEETDA